MELIWKFCMKATGAGVKISWSVWDPNTPPEPAPHEYQVF